MSVSHHTNVESTYSNILLLVITPYFQYLIQFGEHCQNFLPIQPIKKFKNQPMRSLLKKRSVSGTLSLQKRFREWKPRAKTALHQEIHNPKKQGLRHHPNPINTINEQVFPLFIHI